MKESNLRSHHPGYQLDPVFVNSLREAKVVLFVFAIFAVYVVSVCYLCGWDDSGGTESIATVFGMPRWVFWGIVLPWGAANLVTAWFCFRFMTDDDLASDAPVHQTPTIGSASPELEELVDGSSDGSSDVAEAGRR